ncbi:hypothetical protein NKI36_14615 [Mesorhizobium caraganae]|uniref:Uncharacterized protein n=1 Tax=Mesorhizobium caraganae TaxID=483206 RepID=A0ABV1YZU1_9HYPH
MYFIALATDHDGTMAHEGVVSRETFATLDRFKKSGRKLVLLTGRELPDLNADDLWLGRDRRTSTGNWFPPTDSLVICVQNFRTEEARSASGSGAAPAIKNQRPAGLGPGFLAKTGWWAISRALRFSPRGHGRVSHVNYFGRQGCGTNA